MEKNTLGIHDADRVSVRTYSLIPSFALRIVPRFILRGMYKKSMEQAVAEYETPAMGGISEDFNSIATTTVTLEREVQRRGLDRMPLNPNEQGPDAFATEVWKDY